MRYEMSLPAKMFPAMRDAETAERSPQEWGRILGDAFLKLDGIDTGRAPSGAGKKLQARLAVAGLAMRSYPRIKRELVAAGYDRKRVESMRSARRSPFIRPARTVTCTRKS